MKNFIISLSLLLGLPLYSQAQNTPGPTDEQAKPATPPSMQFMENTFALGYVDTSKTAVINRYYLPEQSPKMFSHELSILLYPNVTDPDIRAKNASIALTKNGQTCELAAQNPEGTIGMYSIETLETSVLYNIYAYSSTSDGKHMVIKQLTMRANIDKKESVVESMKKDRNAFLANLAKARFPKIVYPPKPKDLQFVEEKVTSIILKGQQWIIDEKFAEKHGAKPLNHIPFSINIVTPETGKVTFQTRPDVLDLVRFTWSNNENIMRESIRFTTLTLPEEMPLETKLNTAAQMIEKRIVPNFFKAHKKGAIVKRYKTKIGPYSAAVLLGKLTTQEGTDMFIKFVAIIPSKNSKGLIAIMLLNPEQIDPKEINNNLANGYVQQLLHSVRFLRKQAAE